MAEPLRLATILAHPDDETFGVGGTLLRYVDEGIECHSLCLTRGDQGWNADWRPEPAPAEIAAIRAAELEEAGRRIGIASVTSLQYPDGKLAVSPREGVVADIVSWLRRVRPDVVITWGPDGGYGHPDHIAAGERALEAIAIAGGVRRCYRFVATDAMVASIESFPDFKAYVETLEVKPHRWKRGELGAAVDVLPYAERKWHAMQAHRSQDFDLRRWEPYVLGRQAEWSEESYLREFPDPTGALETDLFAALRLSGGHPPAPPVRR